MTSKTAPSSAEARDVMDTKHGSAPQYKPDTWNLWHSTGDEPVESGLWRCTTDWRMWWWGEWNEVGVEEPVKVEMGRTNLTTSQS